MDPIVVITSNEAFITNILENRLYYHYYGGARQKRKT